MNEPKMFKGIQVINIDTYQGGIPSRHDLVVFEGAKGKDPAALILYGFDEVGEMDGEFIKPMYGFMSMDQVPS